MPDRILIAKELGDLLKVLAHSDRIRLIEELRSGECDVSSLAERLELPAARVSQHLSLMKAHRIVMERRDGRRHCYTLIQPELAEWIVDGLVFVEGRSGQVDQNAIKSVRALWSLQNGSSQ